MLLFLVGNTILSKDWFKAVTNLETISNNFLTSLPSLTLILTMSCNEEKIPVALILLISSWKSSIFSKWLILFLNFTRFENSDVVPLVLFIST